MKEFFQEFSQIQWVGFSILAGALFIQLFYYLFIYIRVAFAKTNETSQAQNPGVSVIICAKNELDNLQKFLPSVLNQKYPDFEVIVVNDCSEDQTEMYLAQLELEVKHLRHTTIEPDPKFRHGKKLAVSIGIKAAKHNILVFTDADCYPESENWLSQMVNSYNTGTELVLGYGKYKTDQGLLNKMVRFDTFFIAMQYLGFAKMGRPYMGVGRNMSYRKALFLKGKGFASHYHVMSGDDDLFVNENANSKNTRITIHPDSFTTSLAPATFIDWFKQKKRHLSTAKYYRFVDKFLLGLEPFSKLIFYGAVIYFLCSNFWLVGISAYGFRLIVQLLIIKLGMNKLGEKKVFLLIPLLDIILPLIHLILIFANKKNAKNRKWN